MRRGSKENFDIESSCHNLARVVPEPGNLDVFAAAQRDGVHRVVQLRPFRTFSLQGGEVGFQAVHGFIDRIPADGKGDSDAVLVS